MRLGSAIGSGSAYLAAGGRQRGIIVAIPARTWRSRIPIEPRNGYDPLNRLAGVSIAGQPCQTFGYEDQGRHVRTTVDTTNAYFLYDGADILAENSTWGTPAARYTHGPGIDQPLLRTMATGT